MKDAISGLTFCLIVISAISNMIIIDRVFQRIHMSNLKNAFKDHANEKTRLSSFNESAINVDKPVQSDEKIEISEDLAGYFHLKVPPSNNGP